MIGAIATILANKLGLTGALATIVAWIIIIVIVAGAVTAGYHYIKHLGYVEKGNEIEQQNNRAGAAGDGARMSYDQCNDRNGVYHFDTGRCVGP